MNINSYFIIIFVGLLVIFSFMEPLNIKGQEPKDTPLFELTSFTIHELNDKGLSTLMQGEKALSFDDKYLVSNIDYTDNSKDLIVNVKAQHGVYKDDVVNLKGNVVFNREDGLIIETDDIIYNKNTGLVNSDEKTTMRKNDDNIVGATLTYDINQEILKVTDVMAIFKFKEEKK